MHTLLAPPVTAWLEQGCLRQLVLVVTEADTKEVLERWTFDIDTNKEVLAGTGWVRRCGGCGGRSNVGFCAGTRLG